jgi:hypothetical protein
MCTRFGGKISCYLSRLRSHKFLCLVLIGLAIRLVLAPFSSEPYDVSVFYVVNNDLMAGLNPYTTNSFSYPPLWAYTTYPGLGIVSLLASPKLFGASPAALGLLSDSWNLPLAITSPLFNIMLKLPLIVTDLVIGIVIYDVLKALMDEKHAMTGFILWFLNPLVIFIDSVHGQFDVIPTLMTVLAFFLLVKRKYFLSGVAIGMGIAFKIYPIFLAPLYVISIAKLEKNDYLNNSKSLRKTLTKCSQFISGGIFSLAIFLLPLVNSNLVPDVFTRVEFPNSVGGLTVFGVLHAQGFEWLLHLVLSQSRLLYLGLTGVSLVAVTFICAICFLGNGDFIETFLLGSIAILLIVYITSLVVNSQYVLWILPFLILSYGLFGKNKITIGLLSISALIYLFGLGSPLFFFYPLALFPSFISGSAIYSSNQFFQQNVSWFIFIISAVTAVFSIFICLGNTVNSLLKKQKKSSMIRDKRTHGQEGLGNSTFGPKWHIHPSLVLMGLLVFLMIAQLLVLGFPLVRQNADFEVQSTNFAPNNMLRISYLIKSVGYPVDFKVSATPSTLSEGIENREILIYYDDAYPSSLVGPSSWIGLVDHIPVELKLRSYSGSIQTVDANGLKNALTLDKNCVIVIPSGVLPETVHASNKTLIGDWLRSGGTLIWIGDAFGYFSGVKGGGLQLFSEANFSEVQTQILGFSLFDTSLTGAERYASTPSNFSDALDLQYPDAKVGAYVFETLDHGGQVLGKTTSQTNPRASIVSVPVGSGHLILFGGAVGRVLTPIGEDAIAHDIAQILCSGFTFSSDIVTSNSHELGRNNALEAFLNIPISQSQNFTGVTIAVFSESPYDRYFKSQFYLIHQQ